MKAAIFNPYLDTLGGGERYTMAVATALVKSGYTVDVEWSDITIKEKLEKRFGISLENINIISDVKRGDGYDLMFWVSDGSIPALKARNNFLHFQVPFINVSGRTLINKVKLMRIKKIICNSNFTKRVIDKEFGVESVVLYPPIAILSFKPKKKENIILNVARFSNLLQAKGQDTLIKTFINFEKINPNWQLVLAGGVEVGSDSLFNLEEMAKGHKIKIIKSPDFKTLRELYGRAKIFWSASGFGVDEERDPQRVEHFGMTLVEAMSAGDVPIVYNAGGYKEIIKSDENGFLWKRASELLRFTKEISESEKHRKELAQKVIKEARRYSYEEFEKQLASYL